MVKKAAAKKAPAKAAAKASSSTAATTVTVKHMAASLAEANELSKRQAEAVLNGMGKVFGSFKGYSIEKSVVEVTQYGDPYSFLPQLLFRTQHG